MVVFSAILHEIAHGFVAEKLGDPTARLAGRLTLNPIPHLDPLMSVIVPVLMFYFSGGTFIFGAAKPVPVNPIMLKEGRKDLAIVALAGPLTNLLIAIIFAIIAKMFPLSFDIQNIVLIIVRFNLLLGFLNLIPVPPLDGSKFFSIILPENLAQQYLAIAPFGLLILFFLLFSTNLGSYLNLLIVSALHLLGF